MKGIKDKTTGRFVKNIPISKECLVCLKSFSPRHYVQKFCGSKCMGIFYKKQYSQRIVIDCNYCDKALAFSPSRLKKVKNIFCNSKCYGNWISKNGIMKGEKSHGWKGGVLTINQKIRTSRKYKLWARAIRERDGYKCVICHSTGTLHVDHVIPFSIIIQEIKKDFGIENLFIKAMAYKPLWDKSNGRTLCIECHKKTDTYLNINNNKILCHTL